MIRTLLVLADGGGVGGMTAAHHHDDGERVKEFSATDIKDARATVVEVAIPEAKK